MNDKSCPICRTPLKIVPAGKSKTNGKPYPAFYACPNRCNLREVMDTRVESAPQGWSQASPAAPKQPANESLASTEMLLAIQDIKRMCNAILDILNAEMGGRE
jgi:hypothetical protein